MIFAPAQKVLQSFFPAALYVGVLERRRSRKSVPASLQWERGGEGERRASVAQESSLSLSFSGAKLNVLEALRDEREVGRRACAVDKKRALLSLSCVHVPRAGYLQCC